MYFFGTTLSILKQLLDIAVVAYVIYRFLLLSKGTRTMQIFVVLAGFLALYMASQETFLDLVTFRWLLDKFSSVALLVIIVLYQDEIRRSISRLRWFDHFLKGRTLTPARSLEELVKAVRTLAAKRIGALVVIERTGSLEPFMAESGIRLDGFLTKELLFALFLSSHENPTHDGAVIISKDRVLSAGVILPLTSRSDLEAWVGTRHRAALGLSEMVDAVMVVVSEETGRISVAVDGELRAGLSPDELRQILSDEISQQARMTVVGRLREMAQRSRGESEK
jgi:diadenylate cyclase